MSLSFLTDGTPSVKTPEPYVYGRSDGEEAAALEVLKTFESFFSASPNCYVKASVAHSWFPGWMSEQSKHRILQRMCRDGNTVRSLEDPETEVITHYRCGVKYIASASREGVREYKKSEDYAPEDTSGLLLDEAHLVVSREARERILRIAELFGASQGTSALIGEIFTRDSVPQDKGLNTKLIKKSLRVNDFGSALDLSDSAIINRLHVLEALGVLRRPDGLRFREVVLTPTWRMKVEYRSHIGPAFGFPKKVSTEEADMYWRHCRDTTGYYQHALVDLMVRLFQREAYKDGICLDAISGEANQDEKTRVMHRARTMKGGRGVSYALGPFVRLGYFYNKSSDSTGRVDDSKSPYTLGRVPE